MSELPTDDFAHLEELLSQQQGTLVRYVPATTISLQELMGGFKEGVNVSAEDVKFLLMRFIEEAWEGEGPSRKVLDAIGELRKMVDNQKDRDAGEAGMIAFLKEARREHEALDIEAEVT